MSWDIRDVLLQLVAVGKEERRVNTFNRFDVVAEACDVVISIDSRVFVREVGKEGESVEDVKTATSWRQLREISVTAAGLVQTNIVGS